VKYILFSRACRLAAEPYEAFCLPLSSPKSTRTSLVPFAESLVAGSFFVWISRPFFSTPNFHCYCLRRHSFSFLSSQSVSHLPLPAPPPLFLFVPPSHSHTGWVFQFASSGNIPPRSRHFPFLFFFFPLFHHVAPPGPVDIDRSPLSAVRVLPFLFIMGFPGQSVCVFPPAAGPPPPPPPFTVSTPRPRAKSPFFCGFWDVFHRSPHHFFLCIRGFTQDCYTFLVYRFPPPLLCCLFFSE